MGIDVIIVLFTSIVSIYIIEHYAINNPILGHKIAIFCYTFYNPITNKILFIILSYWLIRLLYRKTILYKNKYLILIFFVGTYLLISGIIGLSLSTTFEFKEINSALISPYFNGIIWSIIIASTLKTLNDIKSFVYTYVGFRLFEIGVTGLYLYFFQYENLKLVSLLLKDYIRLDVDETKRLISFASRNANEAAFLLVGIGGFVFVKLYHKMSIANFIYFLIFSSALFLTWTRSGWIFFIILMIYFFYKRGRIKIDFFYSMFFLIFGFLIPFILFFFNYAEKDNRIISNDSLIMRLDLYWQYLNSLKLLPIFYGIFENIWEINRRLSISMYISSENIFLDTFVKYGLLGGSLFFLTCLIFIHKYFMISKTLKRKHDILSMQDSDFIIMLYSTFYIVLLMSNTSLFEQNSYIWLLFGISVPLKQNLISNQVTITKNQN